MGDMGKQSSSSSSSSGDDDPEAVQHTDGLPDAETLAELSSAVRDSYGTRPPTFLAEASHRIPDPSLPLCPADHAIADEKIFLYETSHTTTVVEHRVPCASLARQPTLTAC